MSHVSTVIGQKIRKIRELKGFSQEYVANKLDLTQKAYSNIENGKTKLDFDRLEVIANIFEVDAFNILNFDEKALFNNFNHATQTGSFGVFYTSEEERKLYNGRIQQLEKENNFLREEITFLRSLVKGDNQ